MLLELVATPGPPPIDLAAESNHRIANHLSLVAGLVRMRASRLRKDPAMMSRDEVGAILGEIGGRLEAVGRLHRLLAREPEGASIDLGPYLSDLAEGLVSCLSAPGQTQLRFLCETGCSVPAGDALRIALIASEVITNAIKYAHPTGIAGTLRLACRKTADGGLAVEISDDGVGLPDGFDPVGTGSLGFRMMRAIAEQLRAAIAFDNKGLGLRFSLQLPTPAAAG
jgi:two-component sensor histidine kinase